MATPFNSADVVRLVYCHLVYLYFTCTIFCLCTTQVPWVLGIEPSAPNPPSYLFQLLLVGSSKC